MKRFASLISLSSILLGCATQTEFNIDTTLDLSDNDPGDGICAAAGGQCSLRAAIEETNASGAGANILINFVSSGTYALDASQGDGLVIEPPTKAIRIRGCCGNAALTTIQPQGASRILTIQAGAVELERLRFTGAIAVGVGANGGAILVEGSSQVFMDQCILEGNAAPQGRGGAVYVEDDVSLMEITNSVIRDNDASDAGIGGAGGVGGHAVFRIIDSLFENNTGSGGGVRLRDSNGFGGPPNHQIVRSTFRDNESNNNNGGGGLRIGVENDTVLVSNSTFSSNTATTIGGGISAISGDIAIEHSTFSENLAHDQGDAIFVASGSEVRLRNNLIDENGAFGSDSDVSCTGASILVLDGFNLIESIDDSCDFEDENAADQDDVGSVNTELAGYTEDPIGHYPLRSTSPAIDHGPSTCLSADQIGNDRPVNGDGVGGAACDTGSFEFQGD